MIPYGKQNISQNDIEGVIEVLKSEWLTQGPKVPYFENAVASRVGAKQGVAVNSATSALHIACLALDVGPGDIVWTSPNTFVASSNAALFCGATVDFVDINPHTYNMSIDRLSEKLLEAKSKGTLPKVVIPVHFAGQPCDMHTIHSLASEFGFKVIEDASHAIGATYWEAKEQKVATSTREHIKVGACVHSDITIFSFHPVKIVTSGEGGMAVANDARLIERMRRFRAHGITSNRGQFAERPDCEIWNYQQIDLGFNYRMTDIHAALGTKQLERLDTFLEKRHIIANRYDDRLKADGLVNPTQATNTRSSYHLYPVRIDSDKSCHRQIDIYHALRAAGIGVNLHYVPVYRQPFYEKLGFVKGYCPEAERYHREAISLPIFPDLSMSQQDEVIDLVNSLVE